MEAAQADPARFEALYRKYVAQVYSYAYYELRDRHEAEDATERTFLAALAHLARFEERARPDDGDGASTFRVWLFRIARNVVAERHRSRRRRPETPLDGAADIVAPLDLEGDVARRDEARTALAAIDRLPGDRRRALILRFVDEMSTAEIAGVLGRTEGAVRVLIHRALRSVARRPGRAGPVTRPATGRDETEIDALVTDRYLESLLAAQGAGATSTPAPVALDPGLRDVAERLARGLPRLHPSFRFEEALSARLTAAALARRLPQAAGGEGSVVTMPLASGDDPALAAYLDGIALEDDPDLVRPLLIGGALTSAALSLAGAAYVAWRFRRPAGTPMARAIRAVARARLD